MIRSETLLFIILLFTFIRVSIQKFRGNSKTDYLFISLFVLLAPFNFEWTVWKLADGGGFKTRDLDYLGEVNALVGFGNFGSNVSLNIGLFLSVLLLVSGYRSFDKKVFSFKNNKWFYLLLVFCLISFFNPYNDIKLSTLPLIAYIFQYLLLFKIIDSNFDSSTILKGVFDGLLLLTVANFLLVICYPLLKISSVAEFFYGTVAYINATRREGYPAAVGIFVHPVITGIFTLIPIAFFTCCYSNNYKSKSLITILLIANCWTCFFCFSRTSYIAIFISLLVLLVYFFRKQNKITKSLKTIFYLVPLAIVLYFYLSVYENLLLFKDAGDLLDFRTNHWKLASEVWSHSKLIGVGLNAHIHYIQNTPLFNTGIDMSTGYINRAIHNMHLIVLTETGLIGLAAWIYFLISMIKRCIISATVDVPLNIMKLTFLAILIGLVIVYGSFNPFPYSFLSLILFFGFFSNSDFNQTIKTVNAN